MFCGGRNLKLTYSVWAALKQNLSLNLKVENALNYARLSSYCTSSVGEKATEVGHQSRPDVAPKGGIDSAKRKRPKLHHRVLSKAEKRVNKDFWGKKEKLQEEDTFGSFVTEDKVGNLPLQLKGRRKSNRQKTDIQRGGQDEQLTEQRLDNRSDKKFSRKTSPKNDTFETSSEVGGSKYKHRNESTKTQKQKLHRRTKSESDAKDSSSYSHRDNVISDVKMKNSNTFDNFSKKRVPGKVESFRTGKHTSERSERNNDMWPNRNERDSAMQRNRRDKSPGVQYEKSGNDRDGTMQRNRRDKSPGVQYEKSGDDRDSTMQRNRRDKSPGVQYEKSGNDRDGTMQRNRRDKNSGVQFKGSGNENGSTIQKSRIEKDSAMQTNRNDRITGFQFKKSGSERGSVMQTSRNDRNNRSNYQNTNTKISRSSDSERSRRPQRDNFTDIFGTLNEDDFEFMTSSGGVKEISEENIGSEEETGEEEEVEKPYKRLAFARKGHNHLFYERKIMRKGKQGKVREAISLLEDRMLKEDRVMPSDATFTTLIGICGRAGYTKKAFQLFKKMKDMSIQPRDATYTALFNACANCPWKGEGLRQAKNLKDLVMIKGHETNLITYKAMIKAFSFCGDTKTAFLIADEAIAKFKPDEEFFSFLLMASVCDKEAGFRHAIQVWRLMRKKKIRPDIFHYNLLLMIIKQCSIGDQEVIHNVIPAGNQNLLQITSTRNKHLSDSTPPPARRKQLSEKTPRNLQSGGLITSKDEHKTQTLQDEQETNLENSTSNVKEELKGCELDKYETEIMVPETAAVDQKSAISKVPDILNPKEVYDEVVSLGEIVTAQDRLSLFGGMSGFLQHMEKNKVQANCKTFTQLLEMIPETAEAEDELIKVMVSSGSKPDVHFYNMLIRRRCFRNDFDEAKDVMNSVRKYKLKPNIVTYSCLSMTCRKLDQALDLLQEMEEAEILPNEVIMSQLIKYSNFEFRYKLLMIQKMENLNIQPDERTLAIIEKSIADAREKILQKERGHEVTDYFKSKYFMKSFESFKSFYEEWLQRIVVTKPKTFRSTKDNVGGPIQM